MGATVDPSAAASHLAGADPVMAELVRAYGIISRPARERDPFRALSRAITFQQLSGAAAGTIYGRFCNLFVDGRPDPVGTLALTDEVLREAGLSRQKIASIRALAVHAASGELTMDQVDGWTDDEVVAHLTRVRGVGRWTAEMYLMFSLQRPDVLPVNDLGLNRAMMRLYRLPAPLVPGDVRAVGAPWRPHATMACWYLWRSEDTRVPDASGDGRMASSAS